MFFIHATHPRRGSFKSLAIAAAGILAAASSMLGGCANTTVSRSDKLAPGTAGDWGAAWNALRVERHGTVPGVAGSALATIYPAGTPPRYAALGATPLPAAKDRIVLYVNASALPPRNALCAEPELFRPGSQSGNYAKLTAALCQGTTVVTTASGQALAANQSVAGLRQSFGAINGELFYALSPGWNVSN